MADSPAVTSAKLAAADTDYSRKYGVDETYWTHFLDWRIATSADWNSALTLIQATAPEATGFIGHLRSMRDIARTREELDSGERIMPENLNRIDRAADATVGILSEYAAATGVATDPHTIGRATLASLRVIFPDTLDSVLAERIAAAILARPFADTAACAPSR